MGQKPKVWWTEEELADMTPRSALDAVHAMQANVELRKKRGELYEKDEIDKTHAEMVEVMRRDLLGTLPLRLSRMLSSRKLTPAQVRVLALEAINETIAGWRASEFPTPEAKDAEPARVNRTQKR